MVDKWCFALDKRGMNTARLKITRGLGSVPMIEGPAETEKLVAS